MLKNRPAQDISVVWETLTLVYAASEHRESGGEEMNTCLGENRDTLMLKRHFISLVFSVFYIY